MNRGDPLKIVAAILQAPVTEQILRRLALQARAEPGVDSGRRGSVYRKGLPDV